MGYSVMTAELKNNRRYDQALVNSETSRGSKNYEEIPLAEAEIDHFVITHQKWDFGAEAFSDSFESSPPLRWLHGSRRAKSSSSP